MNLKNLFALKTLEKRASTHFKPMSITIKCLFFGESKSITSLSEKEITLPIGSTTSDLISTLEADFPTLKILLQRSVLAVNLEYIEKDQQQTLNNNDEVAIIPPLSGG